MAKIRVSVQIAPKRDSVALPGAAGLHLHGSERHGLAAGCVDDVNLRKTVVFFEFSLCLSRACLGKKTAFIYKLLKTTVFSYGVHEGVVDIGGCGGEALPAETTSFTSTFPMFLKCFPYVCPEPVLVK